MAQTVLGFRWFVDGIDPDNNEMNAIGALASLAHSQPSLGERLLGFPWLADDLAEFEWEVVGWLPFLSSRHPSMVEHLLNLPWLADDVTEPESQAVEYFANLAFENLSFAERLVASTWITDGVTEPESQAVGYFANLAHENLSLAERLVASTWIADGVTESESRTVDYLAELAEENLLRAERALSLPWIADGVTEEELLWLSFREEVIEVAPEIAISEAKILNEVSDLTTDVLRSLRSMLRNEPSQLQELVSQSWFQDGLTAEEGALVVVLQSIDGEENTFLSLIEGGHTVSDTISLQLAGEVHLYAVSPFPLQEGVLRTMRTGTRVMEEFMGSPWNNPSVIVFVESEGDTGGGGGKYRGSHIVVKNSHPGTLYHELGHYYLNSMPAWLIEGGAEFLRGYTLHHTEEDPGHSLQYRRGIVSQAVEGCAAEGAANIQGMA